MTLYITEHANILMRSKVGITTPPLASYSLSSLGTSTGGTFPKPQAGCQYIRVSADAGSYLALAATTAGTLGSTNAFRIPPNGPAEVFAATTALFVCAAST